MHDHIQAMRQAKLAGSTQSRCKEAIVSFLAWNRQSLGRPVKIRGVKLQPTLLDVQLPAQAKRRDVLAGASPDAALATCLVAQAGTRPATIGNSHGTDGLQEPHALPHFLGPEGCHVLQVSARKRAAAREKLGPTSALVRPRNIPRAFNSSLSVSNLIRRAMRRAGVKEMPYIWRSYFNNACLLAERDGLDGASWPTWAMETRSSNNRPSLTRGIWIGGVN